MSSGYPIQVAERYVLRVYTENPKRACCLSRNERRAVKRVSLGLMLRMLRFYTTEVKHANKHCTYAGYSLQNVHLLTGDHQQKHWGKTVLVHVNDDRMKLIKDVIWEKPCITNSIGTFRRLNIRMLCPEIPDYIVCEKHNAKRAVYLNWHYSKNSKQKVFGWLLLPMKLWSVYLMDSLQYNEATGEDLWMAVKRRNTGRWH